MTHATGGARDPGAEYERRLEIHRQVADERGARARTLSNLRLAVFVAVLVLSWLAFASKVLSGWWPGLATAVFVGLIVAHDRVLQARDRAARAVAFYEAGLARLDGSWPGAGVRGEDFADPEHPYSADLDLFGKGSLFELLCAARTRAGEATLAGWLLAPSDDESVAARQAAVAELAPGLDLREDLALLGEDVRAGLHAGVLGRWGEAPPLLEPGLARFAAPVFASISVAALGAWLVLATGPLPVLVAIGAQCAFAAWWRPRVAKVIAAVDLPARDLALLAELLARLEAEQFESPRLVALRSALDTDGQAPSRRIAQLRRLVDLLDARRNQFFAPIGALLLWTTQVAFALERWRATCGPALERWVEAVGEVEALCSFAGFAWERPDLTFPRVSSEDGPHFEAEGLGHPLLPRDRCVKNDVRIGGDLRVLVVSGSNMSGKTTLMRTVGTNTVLALAGAPVRAQRLAVSQLAIGASIRVLDSLLEGRSRFYAEIRRLRQITELCSGERAVLFLLDEILHGTNSHDRGIGAEAVVRGLVDRGAIGIVTTHDLALARVAESLAPRGANVHFQDHLEDGRMAFDYRLQPGVVTKSNALELMRAVGLEV